MFLFQRAHLNPVTSVGRRTRRHKVQKREWAHVIDVRKPMTNFRELVPDMAHKVLHGIKAKWFNTHRCYLRSIPLNLIPSRKKQFII